MPCCFPPRNASRKIPSEVAVCLSRTQVGNISQEQRVYNETCKRWQNNKKLVRATGTKINFNEMVRKTGASDPTCRKAGLTTKIKIYPTAISNGELQRLKQASHTLTLEERVEEMEKLEEQERLLMQESYERKKAMKEIDDARLKAKLEKAGTVKKDDSDDEKTHVLERAFVAKFEQEEEVKRANQAILNAKIQIIRDAQIQERNEIKEELLKEDKRLDQMILDDAKDFIKQDEKNFEDSRLQKRHLAAELHKQIQQKENLRNLEAERNEEEGRINKAAEKLRKRDEELKREIIKKKRAALKKDLDMANEMHSQYKRTLFEQSRAADMQVQAYMKQKEERERKAALELKLVKESYERRNQFIFDRQAKLLALKEEQGAFALRRDQETKDREYRQMEREKAVKRKEALDKLKREREKQLLDIKFRQALQMSRNEYDFNEIVKKLKIDDAKSKETLQNRIKARDKYREEIIRQMNEKEMERREGENRARNEYFAWKEKEETRAKNIKTIIQSKVNAMREAKMPEKYIKDLEAQLSLK